jgi:hypothetical protein
MVEASKPLIQPFSGKQTGFQAQLDGKELLFGAPAGMNKPIGAHRERIIHKMEPRIQLYARKLR